MWQFRRYHSFAELARQRGLPRSRPTGENAHLCAGSGFGPWEFSGLSHDAQRRCCGHH